MAAAWGPEVTLWFVAAALMLVLAALLLRLDWRVPAHRSLALLFAVAAAYNVGFALAVTHQGWQHLLPIATMAVPLASLHFAFIHLLPPDRRRGEGALLAAIFLLLCSLYLLKPTLWADSGRTHVGPLSVALGLVRVGYAVVALLFVMSYMREPDSQRRRSFLTAALGFSFLPTYGAISEFVLVDVLEMRPPVGYIPIHLTTVLAIVPVIALFAILARHTLHTQSEAAKRDLARLLLAFLLPGLSVIAVTLVFVLQGSADALTADVLFEGLWSILSPLMIAYAVFRQRMYGLEHRVERIVEGVAVALVYVGLAAAAFQLLATRPMGVRLTGAALAIAAVAAAHRPLRRAFNRLLRHAPRDEPPLLARRRQGAAPPPAPEPENATSPER